MIKYYLSLLIFYLFLVNVNLAQEGTFSKQYALGSQVRDLVLAEDKLTLACQYVCPLDTLRSISCSTINTFDLAGEILTSILIDSLYPEGDNRLWFDDNTFYFTGHPHHQGSSRPTSLQLFDTSLSLQNTYSIPPFFGGTNLNEGIIGNEDHLYLYGSNYEPESSIRLGYITKLDRHTFEVLWEKQYPSPRRINNFSSLQWTSDSNLVVINQRYNGAGSGSMSDYEIIKLDTAGQVLNQYTFDDSRGTPPRLLSSSTGSIYFPSDYEPGGNPFYRGYIVKMSADFEQIEWSLWLPYDPFTNGRKYEVYDIQETANGDIVACGTAWDATDGTVLDLHGTWNGFIIRISPQGELRWVKVYQLPSYITPQTDYGRYRASILRKIVETPTGGFIAAGDVGYKPLQVQAVGFPAGLERQIWLLSVDSMGCVAGEECQEVMVMDGINATEANIDIGTKWTYEVVLNGVATTYETYEVIGLTTQNDTLAYVIEEGSGGVLDYMYVAGDSIYFWNRQLDAFQLNYDFSATDNYETTWAGQCFSTDMGTAIAVVDSIRQVTLAGNTLDIQYLDVTYSSTYENLPAKIYAGIGNDYRLKLGLGEDCDVSRVITRLRCYEDSENSYNFVGYPCDSSFVVNVNEIDPTEAYTIYPNPSRGEVNIKGLTGERINYTLFDIAGRQVQQGKLYNGQLYIQQPGVYLLVVHGEAVTQSFKLVVLD